MTELLGIGASHKTAPLALRERIALTDHAAEPLLLELTAHPAIGEAVALSTCNRTELYLLVTDPVEAESAVLALLARRAGIRPTELLDGIYALRNCDAARHLYRVASGLESMIVGEAEVQGQVKRAYEAALAARTTGPMTNKLFRAALATGKRVRTETAISVGRASVASVAVDAAQDALGDLTARHVLLIGAGETAELTARALHDHGVTTMFIANRRRDRAIALAQQFGGASGSFDALPSELARADIVISSTRRRTRCSAPRSWRRSWTSGAARPLLLIDLAVPRDIDPDCARAAGRHRRRHRRPAGPGAAPHLRAQGRGAAGRGDRRGGDPGVRGLARHARGHAHRDRAARARGRHRDPGAGRERGPLGLAVRARPQARRGARPGGRQAPAPRADAAREGPRGPPPPRAASSSCASSSGSTRRLPRRRSSPPRSASCGGVDAAHRHARQRAGARAGTRGGARVAGAGRAHHDHHGRRRGQPARRQVALGRRARGGAAGR